MAPELTGPEDRRKVANVGEVVNQHIERTRQASVRPLGAGSRACDWNQGGWIRTNPRIHAEKATAANEAFAKQWKPVVKMAKKWNDHHDKPVKPSLLVEVMALDLLAPPWGGSYPRELRQFFASAAASLDEEWPDPAGLGPAVSARLAEDPWQREQARRALREAEAACTEALRLEQSGRTGAALDAWQDLFGPRFAKS